MSNEEFISVECVKSAMRVINQFCEKQPYCEACAMFIRDNYGGCCLQRSPCNWKIEDDYCYECTGYGDDYSENENGELIHNCDTCQLLEGDE